MLKEREEYYIKLIKESKSLIEVCRKAGIVPTTGNYDTLKKVINNNKVDISHFKRNGGTAGGVKKEISEYLIKGSNISSFKLKNKLLKEGYKEKRCEKCKNTEWYGEPIPLELHHINGDNTDNRLENLQILCPNCHAFTDTYGGKNQKLNVQKRYCVKCGKELERGQILYCSFECRYGNPDEEVKKELVNCSTVKELSKKTGHTEKTIKNVLKRNNINLKDDVKDNNDKEKKELIKELINDFKEIGSYVGVAKKYKISDVGLKKRCQKLNIIDEISKYITSRPRNNKKIKNYGSK
jgi:hypothetical protein